MSRLQTTFGSLATCSAAERRLLSPIKKKTDLQLPRVIASTWSIAGNEVREIWQEFGINCFIRVGEFLCEKQKNKLFFFKPGQLYAVAAGRGSMLSPLYWSQCSVSCLHKWLISQSHCTHKRLHFRHADAVRTTSWRSKQASECGTKKKDSSDFEHGLVVGVGCNNILKQPLITTEVCRVATPSTLTQYTWTFTGPFK